jgi:hypothetical protein
MSCDQLERKERAGLKSCTATKERDRDNGSAAKAAAGLPALHSG